MPSNYLILCHPLLLLPSIFPSIRVFSNESALRMRWPKFIGVSALASVLPMNTQDWSPLGWTGWISLQSKRLSRVFSNTTVQCYLTILCSIEVAKVNILVLFWILQYKLPAFHHWVWCYHWVQCGFSYMALIVWNNFLLVLVCWIFLSWNGVKFYQHFFCINWYDHISPLHSVNGIILLICCGILFASILLRILVSSFLFL